MIEITGRSFVDVLLVAAFVHSTLFGDSFTVRCLGTVSLTDSSLSQRSLKQYPYHCLGIQLTAHSPAVEQRINTRHTHKLFF